MTKQLGHVVVQYVLPMLVVGAAVTGVWALGRKPEAPRRQQASRTSVLVDVVEVREHTGGLEILTTGVCVPYREVEVSAEVSGRVVFKSEALRPGRFVREGEELLRIDPEEIDIEIERLNGEIARIDAELDQADIEKQNAIRLVELSKAVVQHHVNEAARAQDLHRSGVATLSAFETVQNSVLSARKELTTQENLVLQLDATKRALELTRQLTTIQLKDVQLDRRRTTLKAPCSGVVVETHVEVNSHLDPGELVARIDDTSRAEVQCSLLADDLDYVACPVSEVGVETDEISLPGSSAYELPPVEATVTFQRGGSEHEWQGTLCRRDGVGFDERTRTLPVRIDVRETISSRTMNRPEMALVSGMFVNVALRCESERKLAAIPDSAVRPGDQVWVVRDGVLRIEPIRIVQISAGQALIDLADSGVEIGDEVIHSPVPNARDGLSVSTDERRSRPSGGSGRKPGSPAKSREGRPK